MSKKSQPLSKQNKQQKTQIVDQQNEPFLRAMQKKVRNINKKLTEISQLEQKDNLKPEQIEKINRKEALTEERKKYQQNAAFYKEVYAENVEQYRSQQLKELDTLARAITIYHAFPKFPEHAKLNKLWKGLQSIEGENLSKAIKNLSTLLKDTANDSKLQKALKNFEADNDEVPIRKEDNIVPEESAAETQSASKGTPEIEVHTEEVIITNEERTNENGETAFIKTVERVKDGVIEEFKVTVVDEQPVKQSEENTPPPAPAPHTHEKQEGNPQQPAGTAQQERPQTRKEDRPQRDRRNNRQRGQNGEFKERGDYRGQRRGGEDRRPYNREGGDKKSYRPKYQEKGGEKVQAKNTQPVDDSSSDEESPKVKNFKRDQIQKLQDEGFIVVGKPKPKGRDQTNTYSHQHGRKAGHHNLAHH